MLGRDVFKLEMVLVILKRLSLAGRSLAVALLLGVALVGCGSSAKPSDGGKVTPVPTTAPTLEPTAAPTLEPTMLPSNEPTVEPSGTPTRPATAPAGGVVLIDGAPTAASFWGGNSEVEGEPVATRSVVVADHSEFTEATRISVQSPTGEFWNGQLSFNINAAVAENDVVLIHLYIRSIENSYESGNSFTTVFIENDTYDKYINREISAASEWQEYYLPVTITAAESLGNIALKFGVGAGDRAQVFEVGGVELLSYGSTYTAAQLPMTQPTYEGRELDAEWRAEAEARIEQYRKGDFALTILDASGAPVASQAVAVEFQRHRYHFGSVTVGNILMGDSADSATYRSKVVEMFNQSGPENDLKWGPWAGEWGASFNKTTTLAALQWLRDQGLYTRGHVMVWPSKRNLPELMQEYLPDDPANADPAAKQVVLDHIDDIASATLDYVDEWDVVNEPYDNHYLMDAFGNGVMLDWFSRARTNMPGHGLFINDYSILSAGGRNAAHQQHYEDTIRYLVENEAPITGIGLQSHFGESPTSIAKVYSLLERYSSAFPALDIRATELDINTDDEALQADYTRDFLTIFFSHPSTVGVQLWGFWANAHWLPKAAMYTSDWQLRPNGEAWKELIYSTWWNDFGLVTDTEGRVAARGFYGDYKATVMIDGTATEFEFNLSPNATNEFSFSLATSN
ncbi:endo-1,4-beta-xylanase [Teredinibacter waterburyi]|uniref:endo-1,4-beta-xylanase n=1 Tax=Teredinibacter waterburyi TaxID=1500538 RepID=UPI001FE6D9D4|nr:endo-1,4-beta-xylanase [Teredinibacter waterburyi]